MRQSAYRPPSIHTKKRPSTNDDEEIKPKFFQQLDSTLLVMREDLTDWLNRLMLPEPPILPEQFLDRLADGVLLCQLAQRIHDEAQPFIKTSLSQQSSSGSGDPIRPQIRVASLRHVGVAPDAKRPTVQKNLKWEAHRRVNIDNFLQWCKSCGIDCVVRFETNGLVHGSESRNVILTLYNVARMCTLYAMDVPQLVTLEMEVERQQQEWLDRYASQQEQQIIQMCGRNALHEHHIGTPLLGPVLQRTSTEALKRSGARSRAKSEVRVSREPCVEDLVYETDTSASEPEEISVTSAYSSSCRSERGDRLSQPRRSHTSHTVTNNNHTDIKTPTETSPKHKVNKAHKNRSKTSSQTPSNNVTPTMRSPEHHSSAAMPYVNSQPRRIGKRTSSAMDELDNGEISSPPPPPLPIGRVVDDSSSFGETSCNTSDTNYDSSSSVNTLINTSTDAATQSTEKRYRASSTQIFRHVEDKENQTGKGNVKEICLLDQASSHFDDVTQPPTESDSRSTTPSCTYTSRIPISALLNNPKLNTRDAASNGKLSGQASPASSRRHISKVPVAAGKQRYSARTMSLPSVPNLREVVLKMNSRGANGPGTPDGQPTPVVLADQPTNKLTRVDRSVLATVTQCRCGNPIPVLKLTEGIYQIGSRVVFLRLLRDCVMVRVGGGWEELANYLRSHKLCQARTAVNESGHRYYVCRGEYVPLSERGGDASIPPSTSTLSSMNSTISQLAMEMAMEKTTATASASSSRDSSTLSINLSHPSSMQSSLDRLYYKATVASSSLSGWSGK